MSPRSVDEYKDAMPFLSSSSSSSSSSNSDGPGNNRLVVAIDELGYGQSDNPNRSCTMDEIADCFLCVADSLGLKEFIVVGSLMGCYFALSLAARYPERVKAVILTNPYHYPSTTTKSESSQPSIEKTTNEDNGEPIPDSWQIQDDGSHLSNLWKKRSQWLDPELNTRVVLDELTYLTKRKERYAAGISIQDASSFDFEGAARQVQCPSLFILGAGAVAFFDSIGYEMTTQTVKATSYFQDVEVSPAIKPGSINLMNQDAEQWARIVATFLESKSL
jgi:pimeloyl-ACP methyl ester carboxylesterase